MAQFLTDNAQLISNFIATVAFLFSVYALRESRRQHTESYRAKLVFHVVQQEQKLYLLVGNIGEIAACDISVDFYGMIENPVQYLHILPPGITYRYVLMSLSQIEAYSEQFLHLSIHYKDISRGDSQWIEDYRFNLLEVLKYSCDWNESQHCFDVFPI